MTPQYLIGVDPASKSDESAYVLLKWDPVTETYKVTAFTNDVATAKCWCESTRIGAQWPTT